ncbi:TetR/AcrR family transcriptional regulator [Peterkaempfera sp. SMS 1(5)a]|uniref:TetR/AcrR family transcriptional regulator n=1 Tax=Peterkaempfera podocarpi TaxID=3232308 RepID=UPI00366B3221
MATQEPAAGESAAQDPTAQDPTAQGTAAQGAAARPRKRQARGEKRITELLDAAGQVFAEHGYSATTTNAIAARAGVSPGSLYQYFPNKEAIAEALAERYAARAHATQLILEDPELPGMPLPAILDRVVDPTVVFHCEDPAVHVLLAGPDSPARLHAVHSPLHEAMLSRIATLLRALAPGLTEARVEQTALVTVGVFKGLLPLVLAAPEEHRPALVHELKLVLLGYLRPVVESGSADSGWVE